MVISGISIDVGPSWVSPLGVPLRVPLGVRHRCRRRRQMVISGISIDVGPSWVSWCILLRSTGLELDLYSSDKAIRSRYSEY